jgi:hypothetical protein
MTKEPRLRLADLTEIEKRQLRENYLPGRTGGWRVDAYDAHGRKIGLSLEERRFLVAAGFNDSP